MSSFFVGNYARADFWDGVASVLGWIFIPFIGLFMGILTVFIYILMWVAKYNGFIASPPVTFGWVIVRDVCNMFFILIFLVISFATILRLENYNAKKMIPKLILMAILINFSKTICGLIIDASQVIMFTFVDSFSSVGGLNIISMLQVDKLMSLKNFDRSTSGTDFFNILGGLAIATIYLAISVVVIGALIMTLVIRMVMLWIYIVLSPLAYLLASFPQGKTYADRWWRDFIKYVTVGPLLAFFIWLSFASLGGSTDAIKTGGTNVVEYAAISEAASTDNMLRFMISIAMLIGGMMMAQEMGGMAGTAAGKGMGYIQKGKDKLLTGSQEFGKAAGGKAWAVTKGIDAALLNGKVTSAVNVVKNSSGGGKIGAGLAIAGGAALGATGPLGIVLAGLFGAVAGRVTGKYVGDSWSKDTKTRKEGVEKAVKNDKGEKRMVDKEEYSWNDQRGLFEHTDKDGVTKILNKNGVGVKEEDFNKGGHEAEGRYGDDVERDGKMYRRLNNDRYYQVNDAGRLIDEKGEVVEDYEKGVMHKDLKAPDNLGRWNKFLMTYYDEDKKKGGGIHEAAESEKVKKDQSHYSSMSKEMLHSLMEIEKDSTRKMAIAMTLAIKGGFKNYSQLNNAKDAVAGNSLLLKEFNDAMNKKDMVLNNTDKDGNLKEDAIYSLISSGGVKWSDQNASSMTPRALEMMQRHNPGKFEKDLDSMSRTDKDKASIKTALKRLIDKNETNDETRTAYAKLFGNYTDAFGANIDKMVKVLGSISVSDHNDIDKKQFENPRFIEALNRLTPERIKKVTKSDKLHEDILELIRANYKNDIPADKAS